MQEICKKMREIHEKCAKNAWNTQKMPEMKNAQKWAKCERCKKYSK